MGIKQNNQQHPMNHQHHAARLAKLKLMKDLKYGKVHLRQSLLQLSEFQDINRIFKGRKQFYSIQDIDVDIQVPHTQDNEQQANILVSPAERMENFRKEKINKKIKQRMTQGIWAKEALHAKPRIPKTTKMLEKFEAKYKNEMHISYKQQLRESELNLQKIKKNDKTRFEINNQSQKPLYQSRLVFSNSEQIEPTPRKRFISLKTSLPQKEKFVYPSIREIMQGKIKENIKGPLIDMKSLENALDSYLNQTLRRIKIKIEKQIEPRNSILNSPTRHHEMRSTSRQQERKKAKSNVERSFHRSEQSSKKMIDTMSDFYETKHEKKNIFDRMVKNLKYDRPLTSSIRRKNYTVVGKQTLNPIQEYREISEQERRKIRTENHSFYCKLIEGLENYHEEDIPTTVYILEELKRIFETEYRITQEIFKDLIEIVNTMKIDHRTEDILTEVGDFVGFNLSFTPHESEIK